MGYSQWYMTYMVGKPTKNDLEMVSLPPMFVQRPQAVRDSRTLMVVGFTINIPQMLLAYIWVSYNNSLTWIKAIWGWFPLLTMIIVRSQWGRYNLPRYIPAPWTLWVLVIVGDGETGFDHSKAHRRARGARQTQDGSAREHRESWRQVAIEIDGW